MCSTLWPHLLYSPAKVLESDFEKLFVRVDNKAISNLIYLCKKYKNFD